MVAWRAGFDRIDISKERILIPALDDRGLLPEGVHSGTWNDIHASFATNEHRVNLINNAKRFSVGSLSPLFPSQLYLAGSTFSDKPHPPDIEATIKVDPLMLTADQALLVMQLQAAHFDIKAATKVDFYVTLNHPGQNDFSQFFQYIGEKTAAAKGLNEKDKRGLVEVEQWMTP